MKSADVSEQIADVIHQQFKNARSGVRNMTAITGASQMSGDIRRELMYCAAQLKRREISNELLGKVDANIRLAQATGLVTDEAFEKIMKLLGDVDQ